MHANMLTTYTSFVKLEEVKNFKSLQNNNISSLDESLSKSREEVSLIIGRDITILIVLL